jgi:hypothetical protein
MRIEESATVEVIRDQRKSRGRFCCSVHTATLFLRNAFVPSGQD